MKPKTLRRYFDDSEQSPEIEYVGRSAYIEKQDFNDWVSHIIGKPIDDNEEFLKSEDVMALYGKSYTWLWYMVKNKEMAKPFVLGRTNFWLKSEL